MPEGMLISHGKKGKLKELLFNTFNMQIKLNMS